MSPEVFKSAIFMRAVSATLTCIASSFPASAAGLGLSAMQRFPEGQESVSLCFPSADHQTELPLLSVLALIVQEP